MRWVLYALAVVLALPFIVGVVIGMCVPLAIGPVRRRLMAHVAAIKAVADTPRRVGHVEDQMRTSVRDNLTYLNDRMDGLEGRAQAALRDAKRRYGFPPDAGGES